MEEKNMMKKLKRDKKKRNKVKKEIGEILEGLYISYLIV